ncbi:MAG: phosphoribosylamine--glycine ligase [Acidobacteriaceae bacterium]|jgi:phosphoribosylamine--glycine ligase|nr:phosphoribosylamine--glycine ligase [Acidobacteriaceae bacterium]
MKVLVVGGGAREHALVARFSHELAEGAVLCAPGNPGIARIARTADVEASDLEGLLNLARRESIDLTIVGPELPLSLGIVDAFKKEGRLILGPTAAAARLESSKAFAKAFMARHRVPTARFEVFNSAEAALAFVRERAFGWPLVLKADGLAAGKGVVIAATLEEAERAVTAAMSEHRFGSAGDCLVIEECLSGPEVSFFVLSDGTRALPLGTAQDHKRIFDNDRGPNTGGMGAFAPSPLVDQALSDRIMREIVDPVIAGMAAEGTPFHGFLYVGLMLTDNGPKVIEFNVRFGDPEAQVVLPLVDEPLLPIFLDAARGTLRRERIRVSSDTLVGVVLASRGYPESSESGQPIAGMDAAERLGARVMHAGTKRQGDQVVTAGGRVLTVIGRGPTYAAAIAQAYSGVECISFSGMQYRRDIGKSALAAIK